jgi:hypothetical protein
MHSRSQGGKATKEETRNSGLCARGWALHTAQVVETRTRTLSWKTLADFVQQLLPLMLLIRDEAIRGKSWFSRFSANSPSIFAKPTDYDT